MLIINPLLKISFSGESPSAPNPLKVTVFPFKVIFETHSGPFQSLLGLEKAIATISSTSARSLLLSMGLIDNTRLTRTFVNDLYTKGARNYLLLKPLKDQEKIDH